MEHYTAYPVPIHTPWITYRHNVKGLGQVSEAERERRLAITGVSYRIPVLMDEECHLWWPIGPLLRAAGARRGTTAIEYVRYAGGRLEPYLRKLPNPHLRSAAQWHVRHDGLPVLFALGRYLNWREPAFWAQTGALSATDVLDLITKEPPA